MSTFTAIDLSRLPPPNVVEPLDFELIFEQRKSALIALYPPEQQADIAATLALESEPLTKHLQENAYRELLLRKRINEAAQAVMLSYANDADLDHLGALFGVIRLQLQPGEPDKSIPPVMESNEDLRRRIQLALEGFSTAGPEGAYIFHALSATAHVKDASADAPMFSHAELSPSVASQLPPNVIALKVDYSAGLENPMPGDVVINVLGRNNNGTATPEVVNSVHQALSADDVRPLTDHVRARSAEIIEYQIRATLYMFAGPDSEVVMAAAREAAAAYAQESHRLGRDITLSGVYAALHRPGVQRVELHSPASTMVINRSQAAYCTSIELTMGGLDE